MRTAAILAVSFLVTGLLLTVLYSVLGWLERQRK
jgi:preprotein translocase subunit SecG